ncbi:MAG: ribosome maturation factor RimP [Dactylosporangium sp.]|nr:ribosome maturation factor RimP [Dactylosporangium sp.]NNJ59961.1 ribosome maturation factor RimP [Dactylosporangium sp.]
MAQQRGRAVNRSPRRPGSPPVPGTRGSGPTVDLAGLRRVVAEVAAAEGYDLEHLSAKRVGQRWSVRVSVDSDAGTDLDRIATLSRRISTALDRTETEGQELVPGEYDLEVGSPGTDRPLTAPRHWRRNLGRLVRARAGSRQITGRIVESDDEGVVLDVEGATRRFVFSNLGPGRVQVELSRLADDGIDDGIDDEGEDEE